MYVNNPHYGIKIIDLLNFESKSFNYEDLYGIVGEWLQSEKKYFCVDDDVVWNKFIEFFVDSFYSRTLNFDTTQDFKMRLRKTMRDCYWNAKNIYQSSLIELNPLQTYENVLNRTGEDNSKSEFTGSQQSTQNGTSESTNSNDDTNTMNSTGFNHQLHSDTPADSVNVNDLFSVANNYITDANSQEDGANSRQTSHNEGVSSNQSNTTLSGTQTNENIARNSSIVNELGKGWSGSQVELIEAFNRLNLDVCKFYCDKIEEAGLFSAVLY